MAKRVIGWAVSALVVLFIVGFVVAHGLEGTGDWLVHAGSDVYGFVAGHVPHDHPKATS